MSAETQHIRGGRLLVALLVTIGLLQIAGYWFAGAMVNGDGPLAIPQPDTALYLQSARRVAEGYPFSFSSGSAVSTGSTTVLHPFVFAVPVLLGVSGFALVGVSFWINAFFYLAFLVGWGSVIWKCVSDFKTRCFSCVMLALFPQPAYAALAMSDIGLWLAVSGVFASALAYDRRWLYGAVLLIAPWARPEGMVLVIAFVIVVFGLRLFARDRFRIGDGILAVFGFFSVVGVFALNYFLTGACQFSSVAHKGHFFDEPFSAALIHSADDLLAISRAFFFGHSTALPRHYYMVPIVGGLMFWIGAFVHDWKGLAGWRKWILPLAMVGGVWTVSTSGWQNTNVDRYLAWITPLVVIFESEGYAFVAGRMRSKIAGTFLLAIPLFFSCGTSAVFWGVYNSSAHQCDMAMKFGRELDGVLPEDASVGLVRYGGIAFPLRCRRVATLTGIYSPEFKSHLLPENLETLKNRPETRFSHWMFAGDEGHTAAFVNSQTNIVAVGPDAMTVVAADWTMFDHASEVPKAGVDGLSLAFRVDVGDPEDERRSLYEVTARYGTRPMSAFSKVADLNGAMAIESGRVVWGYDEMFAPLEPGRDVVCVMRTLRSASSAMRHWLHGDLTKEFDFGERQKLVVRVDGKDAGTVEFLVRTDVFSDVKIRIPGSAIVNPVSRIAFMGDHIACCYWFFQ